MLLLLYIFLSFYIRGIDSNHNQVGIYLPISMLDDNNNKSTMSISTSKYNEIARAQDKEDIYALENWYWNYQNGVILESGALN